MKKSILIVIFLFPLFVKAQSTKDSLKFLKDTIELAQLPLDTSGIITYRYIGNVSGVKKNDFYKRAKVWAALVFNSAKNVIQLDDAEGGSLIIKAVTEQSYTYKLWGSEYPIIYYLHFSLHFTFKDEKYRIVIAGFTLETQPYLQTPSRTFTIESSYKILKDWNTNAKNGNMAFNREMGYGGKKAIQGQFSMINNLDSFARSTIEDAKIALSKSAKDDDF
ncbi:DUF4468 domain-containing protein [Mucilaginibacter sp. SP1R1]|uniref:DUF4468 domain-containing protein n=1 Tax=Mucilaginibacter sp. SP1R1 TaxID=2723091 RepID=UPI001611355A|nr:DUF4468 domain-containing protein [Mucilaginibacter sp. SP1R1]MBB6148886.1 hypothetical protein [Mucilaginibacter sp. SP1R1]